MLDLN